MRQIEDEANIGFRRAETRKNSNFLIRESGAVPKRRPKQAKMRSEDKFKINPS